MPFSALASRIGNTTGFNVTISKDNSKEALNSVHKNESDVVIPSSCSSLPGNSLFLPPRIKNITSTALNYNPVTGQIGPSVSSRRYKNKVTDSTIDTSVIYDLRPVEFTTLQGDRDYGFIAEDVEKIIPKLVVSDDVGPYSIRYDMLGFFLLQEMKKLRDVEVELNQRITLLEKRG